MHIQLQSKDFKKYLLKHSILYLDEFMWAQTIVWPDEIIDSISEAGEYAFLYDYEKTGIEDKNIRLEKMNSGD